MLLLELKFVGYQIIRSIALRSQLKQHLKWVVCLFSHFTLLQKFSLIRTILFPNKTSRVCVHKNPWKELLLPCKVPSMQYPFQTPQKTDSALPLCDAAVETNGNKNQASLFAKFQPKGPQTQSLLWKHRQAPYNKGSE